MSVSTHALDTATGAPAAGLRYVLTDAAGAVLADGVTDDDGRGPDLRGVHVGAGVYRMTFHSGEYHRGRGAECFHPEAVICFEITDPDSHHHIPLILAPYGYSTYRGS